MGLDLHKGPAVKVNVIHLNVQDGQLERTQPFSKALGVVEKPILLELVEKALTTALEYLLSIVKRSLDQSIELPRRRSWLVFWSLYSYFQSQIFLTNLFSSAGGVEGGEEQTAYSPPLLSHANSNVLQ